jgi:hypothetical protein
LPEPDQRKIQPAGENGPIDAEFRAGKRYEDDGEEKKVREYIEDAVREADMRDDDRSSDTRNDTRVDEDLLVPGEMLHHCFLRYNNCAI